MSWRRAIVAWIGLGFLAFAIWWPGYSYWSDQVNGVNRRHNQANAYLSDALAYRQQLIQKMREINPNTVYTDPNSQGFVSFGSFVTKKRAQEAIGDWPEPPAWLLVEGDFEEGKVKSAVSEIRVEAEAYERRLEAWRKAGWSLLYGLMGVGALLTAFTRWQTPRQGAGAG